MKNNHRWNVAESKSSSAGTLSPFDVLRKLNSCERPNLFEICAAHDQVSGSAKAMLFDIQFEAVSKNALIRFDCRKPVTVITPNPNIATKNGSFRRGANGVESTSKPFGMRTTIGIYEGKYFAGGDLSSGIARRTGSGLQFMQQARAGMIGDEVLGNGNRAVVDDDDLKERPLQALGIEASQASFKSLRLVEVRNNNGNHWPH